MTNTSVEIKNALAEELLKAEEKGDLVIATSIINNITTPMAEAIKVVYAGIFSPLELAALADLILQATSDERFYDWEMPTLIGYTREDMQKLGEKLRELSIN
jgi:hypothetical protein